MRYLPLLFGVLLFCQTLAQGQAIRVQSLTSEDGLSQDYIQSLFQDSRGFLWIGTFFGLNRYDGTSIKSYLPNLKDKWSLHANLINAVSEDREGILWMGTEMGVAVLDPHSSRFVHLGEKFSHIPSHHTRTVFQDRWGHTWCLQEFPDNTLLLRFRPSSSLKEAIRKGLPPSFHIRVDTLNLPPSYRPNSRFYFLTSDTSLTLADSKGNFFLVNLLDLQAKPTILERIARPIAGNTWYFKNSTTGNAVLIPPDYTFDNHLPAHFLNQVLSLPDGQKLLFRFFNPAVFTFNPKLPPDQMPVYASIDKPTSPARLIDRNGNIWIGTTGYGLRKIQIPEKGYAQEAADKNFYNFAELNDQKIWPGYFHHDQVYDIKSRSSSAAPWLGTLPKEEKVLSVLMDKSRRNYYLILANPAAQKLYLRRFDPVSSSLTDTLLTLKNYTTNPPLLMEDHKGRIWIAAHAGEMVRYDPVNALMQSWNVSPLFPKEMSIQLHSRGMEMDRSGRVWIGYDYGLVRIDPTAQSNQLKAYFNTRGKTIFNNNGIFSIVGDPYDKTILWLGALGGGLVRFDTEKETTSYFTNSNGPSFQVVVGMVLDQNNLLWLATNLGVFCFDPSKQVFLPFEAQRSLSSTSFNASASGKISDGRIAFGNTAGLFLLQPSVLLQSNTFSDKAYVSSIMVNNQLLDPSLLEDKLHLSPSDEIQLNLSHTENNLNIGFSAPTVQNRNTTSFRYRLIGVNNNWANIGTQNEIPLFGLRPGTYTLEIQAIPRQPQENAPISRTFIRISPPWYSSNLAYICYAGLCFGFLFHAFRWNKARLLTRQQVEKERQEAKRIQSLDDFKNNFFAYIAHEIKTPLTIIRGIKEQMLKTEVNTLQVHYLNGIQKESENLLELVDEMIDVTRLQDNTIKLFYEHRDLIPYLRDVLLAYQPLAELKGISLNFSTSLQSLEMDFDPLRTKFILKNLLTNAIRHTPSKGTISVKTYLTGKGEKVVIAVSDSGEGIPPEELPLIFEKYFRGSTAKPHQNHFGLGLTFSKNLIALLQGSISVESTLGQGSTFTCILPTSNPGADVFVYPQKQEDLPGENYLSQDSSPLPPDAPWLLIVEDNPGILSYLQTTLQPFFHLLLAADGQEGIDIANQKIPDLILTDLVMPMLDGLKFSQAIKTNPLTNHIPIVMLSAKTEIHDRVNAQQHGADLFLGKPFHSEELILSLQNLYRLQQTWKGKFVFAQDIETGSWNVGREIPSQDNASNPDHAFIEAILNAFEENYASDSFDVQQLCKILHLSKTQLYRKLSAISNQSAMEMLRNFRLEKAAFMLKNIPEISIKEIAYAVGIKELSHFSNLFKKKFGIAPSEMRKK